MMKYAKRKLLFSLLFTALSAASLCAETFRVAKCHVLELKEDPAYSASEKVGLNDALTIRIPEERLFLEGIEIKMEIPEETATWRDCCGAYVYDGIRPNPTPQQIDFSGNKIFFGVLPGKLSWVLQIPLTQNAQFKTDQYTKTIEKIPSAQGNFVFVRLQQIMKGVPDEVMNSKITFTVRPILSDKGLIKLKLTYPELPEGIATSEDSVTVFVDNVPYLTTDVEKGIVMDTGIHNISVISENYRTEVRKVRIDQAKKIEVPVELKSIEPSVIITAPEGAKVYLDEEPFDSLGKETLLEEGDHKIRCKIGDYEILRTVSVVKGRTYKVNLTVDLQIEESD
jgi:hypothetical protein